MKIKDLSNENKPRERLINNGPKHLSDIELLAIILGSGTKTNDVFDLSTNILNKYSFNELKDITYEDLIKINGIKQAKACKLLACFEIAKRANKNINNNITLDDSKRIYNYIKNDFYLCSNEMLCVIYMDVKLKVIKKIFYPSDSAHMINISFKDIIKESINNNCSCVVIAHNHPSNDVEPSISDIDTTNKFREVFESINILLVDHLIVGENKYFSFNDNGLL